LSGIALAAFASFAAACSDSSGQADGDVGTSGDHLGGGAPTAPTLKTLEERCKLINGRFLDDPTSNDPQFRANIRGTDLGIPVAHGDNIYFFFGDTAGKQGIWPITIESLPDAVGYVPYGSVKSDPNSLCWDLRFIVGATDASVGHSQDARVDADFAFASMTPPAGHDISEFIKNPVGPRGANAFPNAPGDFEVPSGAFSYDGSIYLFYTTVGSPTDVDMKGSYLARWTAPGPNTFPQYDILYAVDERFDAKGQLGGDFINIAPVVSGDYVYLFGTGEFRASPISLARKRLSTLATPGGFDRYDAKTKTWRSYAHSVGDPIVKTSAGEVSVRYFPEIQRFVMLNQEISPKSENQIIARFASRPEGPWTDGTVVASLSDATFKSKYCCVNSFCSGDRMLNCDRAGYYGAYLLPEVRQEQNGTFSIDFVLSTWDPYNVVLMSATFADANAAAPAANE
jgi:hypothetical protein